MDLKRLLVFDRLRFAALLRAVTCVWAVLNLSHCPEPLF